MSTICALSTPAGSGGIAVIRVSGLKAFSISDTIFRPTKVGHTLSLRPTHTLTFGCVIDARGIEIDQVVASVFRGPHSYTGEDVVEFSCHCSPYIINHILTQLVAQGCVMAAPGEFTQRAYLNGRLDLSQAEAVADLIASTSESQHRAALSQLKGGFSRRLGELRQQLLHLTSLLELELDFSDHEDLQFADRREVLQLAQTISAEVGRLITSFRTGNAVRNGIPVAIIGAPNVGKSSLLNALIGDERAIVTNIPGTTRDIIDATMQLAGHTLRFVDTAGIRQTTDTIEALGIERSLVQLEKADIILWVIDASNPSDDLTENLIVTKLQPHQHYLVIRNKCDLLNDSATDDSTVLQTEHTLRVTTAEKSSANASLRTASIINTCAHTTEGIAPLLDALTTLINQHYTQREADIIVTNARHCEALKHAADSLTAVINGLTQGIPSDLVCEDLRLVLHHLADITGGEITPQETLNNIFSHFCIGK